MGKYIDLAGKVFGNLTVIECVGKNSKNVEMWKCICKCGNETVKQKYYLIHGKAKSCGCLKNAVKDITGNVYAKLTVIERAGHDYKNNISLWKCKCECGNEKIVQKSDLTTGHTKSCGCLTKGKDREDLTGQVFERLTVIEYAGKNPSNNAIMWKCKCECGEETITRGTHLKGGLTKSCGCLNKELAPTKNFKHGLYKHPLYKTWVLMRNRCNNPNADNYELYGRRGIKVCDEWNESFEAFHRDMAHTHKEGLTLDRIDVNGDYTPENCRWATGLEQANNTRLTRYIEVFGERMPFRMAARKYNINPKTLENRLDVMELSPEEAVTRPIEKTGRGAK